MLGSHLSIAGGMVNALDAASALRLETVQVFTKNQRQWAVKPLADEAARQWLDGLDELGWRGRTVAHDSYLINLASPDDALWDKSAGLMREEFARCQRLGIPFLVSHPGAHVGSGLERGIERIGEAHAELLGAQEAGDEPGADVTLCLENTAGGGSTIGRTFEELRDTREAIVRHARRRFTNAQAKRIAERVGFCFDTCHALAAGYDIAAFPDGDAGGGSKRSVGEGAELADAMLDEFDRCCGLARLHVVHVNDSMAPRGSRRDRHEHIGKGRVASGAFGAVLSRPELADRHGGLGVPMILETPKGEDEKGRSFDALNIARLKRLRTRVAKLRG